VQKNKIWKEAGIVIAFQEERQLFKGELRDERRYRKAGKQTLPAILTITSLPPASIRRFSFHLA